MKKAKVYFTKDISAESLIKLYDKLGRELKGKVGVKISTGEPGGHNFLNPKLIAPLVSKIKGTIVECNTAYPGRRYHSKDHWVTIKEHGFLDIAPCDILDEDGEFKLPVKNGLRLPYDIVGDHLKNYDSMLILSHFKGHLMGGFGGALKNISIGFASRNGKAFIHSVGATDNPEVMMQNLFDREQDAFIESMADACKAVIEYVKPENMAYINVANRLSVNCDCDANPPEPEMGDIGIFVSLDPVALDQCCYDAVINSKDKGKKSLVERMDSRHGIHIVEAAEQHKLGTREYELVSLD